MKEQHKETVLQNQNAPSFDFCLLTNKKNSKKKKKNQARIRTRTIKVLHPLTWITSRWSLGGCCDVTGDITWLPLLGWVRLTFGSHTSSVESESLGSDTCMRRSRGLRIPPVSSPSAKSGDEMFEIPEKENELNQKDYLGEYLESYLETIKYQTMADKINASIF